MKVDQLAIDDIISQLRGDKCTLGNAKIIREMARSDHQKLGHFNHPEIHFKYEFASFMESQVYRHKSARRMSASEAARRINNIEEIMADQCIEYTEVHMTL